MEVKYEKNILGWFFNFVLLCLFVWVFASSMLLEIYWGTSYYSLSEDRRGRREKIKYFQHAGKAQWNYMWAAHPF